MIQELNGQGLCGNCIYKSSCFSLKNSLKQKRQILYCEEFEEITDVRFGGEEEGPLLFHTFGDYPCFSVKQLIP